MKKMLFIIVALTMSTIMFTSCDPHEVFDYGDEDWYSNAWIYNNTSDTLAVEFPTGSLNVPTQLKLVYPSDTILYSHSKLYEDSKGRPYASYWEIMRDNFSNMHPVRIFLKDNDSVLMQFNPPCRDMGDTNSIFNSHSWSSVRTGKDNKYVRSTFTITEADYGHFSCSKQPNSYWFAPCLLHELSAEIPDMQPYMYYDILDVDIENHDDFKNGLKTRYGTINGVNYNNAIDIIFGNYGF